ncbi:hypothetical protein [Actinomadura viridis]|uniref:Uncharacterized protein n=1 Tax=Actinomadura viridis TaxID=58110 RepID=A0A931GJ44_9ACTN|nr:hypothetical protein [Actinomadura viridis]MBG6088772.1 hypothetical protein [Actinomadura viridis]
MPILIVPLVPALGQIAAPDFSSAPLSPPRGLLQAAKTPDSTSIAAAAAVAERPGTRRIVVLSLSTGHFFQWNFIPLYAML